MGIKSTRLLSRSQAFDMYHNLLAELNNTKPLTNEELGDLLDVLHDRVCERDGRTSFDNFRVVDDWQFEEAQRDWEKY